MTDTEHLMSTEALPTPDSPPLVHPHPGKAVLWLLLFLLVATVSFICYSAVAGALTGYNLAVSGESTVDAETIGVAVGEHMLSANGMAGTYILQTLFVLPFILLAATFSSQSWRKTLALVPVSAKTLQYWLLVLVAYLVVETLVRLVFDLDLGELIGGIANSQNLLLLITISVFAPILEEFIFRGYLFAAWRHTRLGLSGTLLLTSLLFTSLHIGQYSVGILVVLFVFSIILGLAREKTGSLYVPIVLHAVNNFIAGVSIIYFGWV